MLKLISAILLFSQIILSQGITVNRKHYFDNLGGGTPPADTGLIFLDAENGLDIDTATGLTGGLISISTDQAYAGSNSYKISGYGSVSSSEVRRPVFKTPAVTGQTTIWLTYRVFIPWGTAQSQGGWSAISVFDDGDAMTPGAHLLNSDNDTSFNAWMHPWDGTTHSTGWAPGQWHKVEVKFVSGTGSSQDSCWIDETPIYGISNATAVHTVIGARLGGYNWCPAAGEAIYFDNIILSTSRLPLD